MEKTLENSPIKGRSRRTASGAHFAILKYKAEVIHSLVGLIALRMDEKALDAIIEAASKLLNMPLNQQVDVGGKVDD